MIDISYTDLHAWLEKDYRSPGMKKCVNKKAGLWLDYQLIRPLCIFTQGHTSRWKYNLEIVKEPDGQGILGF